MSLPEVLSFCLDVKKPEFLQLLPIYVILGLWRLRNSMIFYGLGASTSWVQHLVMELYQNATYIFH